MNTSRAFRLGVFIVATLAVLATGIFLIGDRQFLFSSTYILKSNFMHVAGLINGAEVRVGGIHKGTVKQIQLPAQPDGGVTVIMAMEKSTRKVIRKDSVASIQTEGLLGDKYVEVTFGSDSAPARGTNRGPPGAGVGARLSIEKTPASRLALLQRSLDLTAVERGAFGIPTFFVGKEIFFGKNTLRDVEEEISRVKSAA